MQLKTRPKTIYYYHLCTNAFSIFVLTSDCDFVYNLHGDDEGGGFRSAREATCSDQVRISTVRIGGTERRDRRDRVLAAELNGPESRHDRPTRAKHRPSNRTQIREFDVRVSTI